MLGAAIPKPQFFVAEGHDLMTTDNLTSTSTLKKKIENREARVGVVGLGYVGLPLLVEFAHAGFKVEGIDTDAAKAESINAGKSYIGDINDDTIEGLVDKGQLTAHSDYSAIGECDAVVICVPTPLRKTRDPDLSYVADSVKNVREEMSAGVLVILESTTYPGTTEEVVLPILQGGETKLGRDFFLAFSPERVDPGPSLTEYNLRNVPKVVGGINQESTELACALYGTFVEKVVPVSHSRVAEMVKLLENTYRSVNIGLVNELALMCHELGVNVWEVINAAKTKPYGFQAFYPGPGLGGHCLPIDPIYLAWKAKLLGFEPRFIDLAERVNSSMPQHVIRLLTDILNEIRKPLNGSHIHILGVAYKPDVSDTRESPAISIIELLRARGAHVTYSDPHVGVLPLPTGEELEDQPVEEFPLEQVDCCVIVTDHNAFPWHDVVDRCSLILDTRNALEKFDGSHIRQL